MRGIYAAACITVIKLQLYIYIYIYMEIVNGKESDNMEKNWKIDDFIRKESRR